MPDLISRHMQAFERALSMSDAGPIEGDVSPASPRSPPLNLSQDGPSSSSGSHYRGASQTWKYGPDNGALLGGGGRELEERGRERIEKLSATSDFAVSYPSHVDHTRMLMTAHSPKSLEVGHLPLNVESS